MRGLLKARERAGRLVVYLAAGTAVLASFPFAGCGGGGDGAGSYLGTASNAAVYVTWTRSGDQLTGQLTEALMPENVNGDVSTDRASFTGTVNGHAVSLTLDQGIGTSTTLTGAMGGDTLRLDYPGANGAVTTIKLHAADGESFNRQLAWLRGRAADAQQQAAEEAAAEQATSDAQGKADAVRTQIDALAEAASNATAANPGLYDSDLETIRSDLDTVKGTYELLTSDQENGYNDTVCDDAASVRDDVRGMEGDIGSMRRDVRDNTNPSLIADDVSQLRQEFMSMQSLDPSLLPPDAPTKQEVNEAIRSGRQTVRAAGGANFAAADKLLAQAKAVKTKAALVCQQAGG